MKPLPNEQYRRALARDLVEALGPVEADFLIDALGMLLNRRSDWPEHLGRHARIKQLQIDLLVQIEDRMMEPDRT